MDIPFKCAIKGRKLFVENVNMSFDYRRALYFHWIFSFGNRFLMKNFLNGEWKLWGIGVLSVGFGLWRMGGVTIWLVFCVSMNIVGFVGEIGGDMGILDVRKCKEIGSLSKLKAFLGYF